MKNEDRQKIIDAMEDLSIALIKNHRYSKTTQYVSDTLSELKNLNGKSFTGTFLYFLNKSAMLRTDENIELNNTEQVLWRKVSSLKNLGNDFFFGVGF